MDETCPLCTGGRGGGGGGSSRTLRTHRRSACSAWSRTRRAGPPAFPPPRTKWTRRVPHPVLIGHAASHTRARLRRARLGGGAPAVPTDRLALALAKSPSLLCRSVDAHLRPVAAFLETEAGLSREAVAAVFGRQPQVFMSSLDKKLRPNLALLRGHLGLDAQQARHPPRRPPPPFARRTAAALWAVSRAVTRARRAARRRSCCRRSRRCSEPLSTQRPLPRFAPRPTFSPRRSRSPRRRSVPWLPGCRRCSPCPWSQPCAQRSSSCSGTLRPSRPTSPASPRHAPRAPAPPRPVICAVSVSGFASRRRARIALSRCRQRVPPTSVAGWSERA